MTNKKSYNTIIVVPCYNEETRLPFQQFLSFINQHSDVLVCFVNDGSSDKTIDVLHQLKEKAENTVAILDIIQNAGKASAVRSGFLHCIKTFSFEKIAYLDADLSTSLEECIELSSQVNSETVFVFGSRIAKVDNNIKRKRYRFLIGRFIATLISNQLRLKVYDTQCGCKIFHHSVVKQSFKETFISKWLFDVEIFHRLIRLLGREKIHMSIKEIPLKAWEDTEESRVKFTYFFKLWVDLYNIGRTYKN